MKHFIIFSTCIYFVVSLRLNQETIDKWEAMARPHQEKCIAESGISRERADTLYRNLDYSDDQKLECYIDCLTKELFFMVDGKFDVDRVIEVANPPKDLAEECARKSENLSKPKPCEAGYTFSSCCIQGTAKRQNP